MPTVLTPGCHATIGGTLLCHATARVYTSHGAAPNPTPAAADGSSDPPAGLLLCSEVAWPLGRRPRLHFATPASTATTTSTAPATATVATRLEPAGMEGSSVGAAAATELKASDRRDGDGGAVVYTAANPAAWTELSAENETYLNLPVLMFLKKRLKEWDTGPCQTGLLPWKMGHGFLQDRI